MRFFSIDIETTGLDPRKHGITEFACVVADLFDPATPIKSFYRWVNPDGYVWSNYCLKLHVDWIKNVIDRLNERPIVVDDERTLICNNVGSLILDFQKWLFVDVGLTLPDENGKWPEPLTLAGKNVGSFDLQFLLGNEFDERMFGRRILDPGPLYIERGDKKPPTLEQCKKRAMASGCEFPSGKEVKHNALDDAMDVVKLLQHYYKGIVRDEKII